MIIFVGSGLLIGGMLGLRLSVLALIPAAFLAVVVAAFSWAMQGAAIEWSLYHLVALLVCLQLGYLAGAGLWFFGRTAFVAGQQKSTAFGHRPSVRFWTHRR
jgi:hypothetical protein